MHELPSSVVHRGVQLRTGAARRPRNAFALAGQRFVTRWHGFALDARLAQGERPESDPRLALRARWLLDRDRRCATAAGWRRIVAEARTEHRFPYFTSTVTAPRSEVLIAEMAILTLAARLEGEFPVVVHGLAMARHLLEDGCGALYVPPEPGALRDAVHAALDALETR